MKGITKIMGKMNKKMNLPQIQKIMMEFEKQNETMGMKEEMMEDAMDDAFADDEDSDEVRDSPLCLPPTLPMRQPLRPCQWRAWPATARVGGTRRVARACIGRHDRVPPTQRSSPNPHTCQPAPVNARVCECPRLSERGSHSERGSRGPTALGRRRIRSSAVSSTSSASRSPMRWARRPPRLSPPREPPAGHRRQGWRRRAMGAGRRAGTTWMRSCRSDWTTCDAREAGRGEHEPAGDCGWRSATRAVGSS